MPRFCQCKQGLGYAILLRHVVMRFLSIIVLLRNPEDARVMAGMLRGWYNIKAQGVYVGSKISVRILVRLVGLLSAKCVYFPCS